MRIKVNDRVVVNKSVETESGYVYKGEKGTVTDTTFPNYYLVKFLYEMIWVDGEYLDKIND